jgi:hypothetical protein
VRPLYFRQASFPPRVSVWVVYRSSTTPLVSVFEQFASGFIFSRMLNINSIESRFKTDLCVHPVCIILVHLGSSSFEKLKNSFGPILCIVSIKRLTEQISTLIILGLLVQPNNPIKTRRYFISILVFRASRSSYQWTINVKKFSCC